MWTLHGANDYNITLTQSGYANLNPYLMPNTDTILEVRDGQVVTVSVDGTPFTMIAPSKYGDSTVDGLFSTTWHVLFSPFVEVKYNPIYGYPENIAGGFIEGGGVSVKTIQLRPTTPSFPLSSTPSP
ncbi:MAG: DUF6174 domain-containing protein [Chloroflexota bacterium]